MIQPSINSVLASAVSASLVAVPFDQIARVMMVSSRLHLGYELIIVDTTGEAYSAHRIDPSFFDSLDYAYIALAASSVNQYYFFYVIF